MIIRFCGYTTWRNLRFFEPFFVLFLLLQLDLSYVEIGMLMAYEKILTGVLESQFKLAMTYLQPYLAKSLGQYDMTVIGGSGAILIGSYYLAQGLLAGLASSLSTTLEKTAGNRERALRIAYTLAVLSLIIAAIATIGLALQWCCHHNPA